MRGAEGLIAAALAHQRLEVRFCPFRRELEAGAPARGETVEPVKLHRNLRAKKRDRCATYNRGVIDGHSFLLGEQYL